MIGTRINKPQTADELNEYSQIAAWCNANNAKIEDMGGYFEVVSAEPTAGEAAEYESARQNSTEARLADIEDALVELAGMLAGGE